MNKLDKNDGAPKAKFNTVSETRESEISRIEGLIFHKKSDIERWSKAAAVAPKWDQRARRIADRIPAGAKVLDIGCGNELLAGFLHQECHYTGADVVKRTNDTVLIDVNDNKWPVGNWDVAVAAGVLEYVYDLDAFFAGIATCAPRVLLTYHISNSDEVASKLVRLENGWLSNYRNSQIITAAEKVKLMIGSVIGWAPKKHFRQYFYILERV